MSRTKFNPNWVGAVILALAVGFSVLRYQAIRARLNLGEDPSDRESTTG